MEWGLLGTVPKQTGKKHQNIFSWFEEGEKQNHITGNVSTRFCNLRKHVKAKLISSSSQITVQKGFSLKISKDGNEKLDVTEVRWTETYNNPAKKKIMNIVVTPELILNKVEVETVDEDCSKLLVWEFGCQVKVWDTTLGCNLHLNSILIPSQYF